MGVRQNPQGTTPKKAPDLSMRVREICRTRNLSLRQLAAMTGIPVATLSKVQNNLATLSFVQLTKLAGGLGIELNDLTAVADAAKETPALRVTKALMAAGLLVIPSGERTIRLLSPLNIARAEADKALAILGKVLSEIS